jgi:hypothetical protein
MYWYIPWYVLGWYMAWYVHNLVHSLVRMGVYMPWYIPWYVWVVVRCWDAHGVRDNAPYFSSTKSAIIDLGKTRPYTMRNSLTQFSLAL